MQTSTSKAKGTIVPARHPMEIKNADKAPERRGKTGSRWIFAVHDVDAQRELVEIGGVAFPSGAAFTEGISICCAYFCDPDVGIH